jgi:hypothetical protein
MTLNPALEGFQPPIRNWPSFPPLRFSWEADCVTLSAESRVETAERRSESDAALIQRPPSFRKR